MIIEVTLWDAFLLGIVFTIGSCIGAAISGFGEGFAKGMRWMK